MAPLLLCCPSLLRAATRPTIIPVAPLIPIRRSPDHPPLQLRHLDGGCRCAFGGRAAGTRGVPLPPFAEGSLGRWMSLWRVRPRGAPLWVAGLCVGSVLGALSAMRPWSAGPRPHVPVWWWGPLHLLLQAAVAAPLGQCGGASRASAPYACGAAVAAAMAAGAAAWVGARPLGAPRLVA